MIRWLWIIIVIVSCAFMTGLEKAEEQQSQQKADPVQLSAYSHLVLICRNDTIFGNGTGFFYQYKGHYFFLTARHNLTGYDQFNKRFIEEGFRCDKILVRVFNKNGEPVFHPVRLDTYNKEFDRTTADVDVELFKLNLPATISVRGIDELEMSTDYFVNAPDSVEIYAFSQEQLLTKMQINSLRPSRFQGILAYAEKQKLAFANSPYFKIFPEAQIGYSGAPVFFKKKRNDLVSISFGGIVSGSSFSDRYSVILKPEEVYKKITAAIREVDSLD